MPVCCSVLQCVAVCCKVLQCVAVCCSVLQCGLFVWYTPIGTQITLQHTATHCNTLQHGHANDRHACHAPKYTYICVRTYKYINTHINTYKYINIHINVWVYSKNFYDICSCMCKYIYVYLHIRI